MSDVGVRQSCIPPARPGPTRVEARGLRLHLADALDGEDADGLAQVAAGDEVVAAVVKGEVVGVHAAVGDLVAAHGVVAQAQAAALDESGLDDAQVLGRGGLELGAARAHANRRSEAAS